MPPITYQLERRDVLKFAGYVNKHAPVNKKLRLVGYSFGLLLGWFTASSTQESFLVKVIMFVLTFVVYAVLVTPLWFALNKLAARWSFSGKEPGVFGEHTVTLLENGITEETELNQSRIAWGGMYAVVDAPEHIYLLIQPHQGHIIPKRAFNTTAEANEFLAQAQGYLSKSKTRNGL